MARLVYGYQNILHTILDEVMMTDTTAQVAVDGFGQFAEKLLVIALGAPWACTIRAAQRCSSVSRFPSPVSTIAGIINRCAA